MLSHIFVNTAINILQMPTGGEPPVKKRQEVELRLSVSATKKEAKKR